MADDMTTVQISKVNSERLGEIAEYYRRSKAMQLEWMIESEYGSLTYLRDRSPHKKMTVKGMGVLPGPDDSNPVTVYDVEVP